jgi:hypothetical protein
MTIQPFDEETINQIETARNIFKTLELQSQDDLWAQERFADLANRANSLIGERVELCLKSMAN